MVDIQVRNGKKTFIDMKIDKDGRIAKINSMINMIINTQVIINQTTAHIPRKIPKTNLIFISTSLQI